MLGRLQSILLTALAVLAVLVGAYAFGGRAARRAVEVKQRREADEVARKVREASRDVDAMDDLGVRGRAARWVRDDPAATD